jgi:hypothetical protein
MRSLLARSSAALVVLTLAGGAFWAWACTPLPQPALTGKVEQRRSTSAASAAFLAYVPQHLSDPVPVPPGTVGWFAERMPATAWPSSSSPTEKARWWSTPKAF